MAYVNHFYFYLWDSDWGAAFWKTTAYAPYPIRLWLNGHEWAKQQLQKIHLRYKALDNGFRIVLVINRPNWAGVSQCYLPRPTAVSWLLD